MRRSGTPRVLFTVLLLFFMHDRMYECGFLYDNVNRCLHCALQVFLHFYLLFYVRCNNKIWNATQTEECVFVCVCCQCGGSLLLPTGGGEELRLQEPSEHTEAVETTGKETNRKKSIQENNKKTGKNKQIQGKNNKNAGKQTRKKQQKL